MLIARANPRDRKGWDGWVGEVSKCIDHYLPLDSIQFATYMQSVTFSIVLTGFLDADLAALDPRDVASVTKAINERWMQAKTSQQLHPHLLSEINDHIFRWVPNRDQYPNPLDFIIPAFETMWRVVAITTVYAYRDESIRHAFLDFGDNSTLPQFQAFKKAGPSVEAVVLEVLRLYPPTRRISRVNPSPPSKFPFAASTTESDSIEVAEIETYHKSQEWGENPTEFDPMRYHPSKGASDLFAFGYGRLKCVASSWAPIAAATIVARILERVDEREFEIKEGEAMGRRDGWGGWSIKRKY
ncbi:hypothetical protein SERLA73DRAFT_186153 [Serpula lacrymans var. lacrymans S7.3]|uniref:Cytochrome P450 n=2 Tax=Serpula lacrymans var. lacrymans TaxID=341189 RepID=F8Q5E0_SERL3|nr:hypothetical protein SERLA73DRAFT_186153 [Serpula lacrymans var. lacrymans S7.3]